MRQQEAAANRFSGGLVQNRTVGGYAQSGYVGQPGSPGGIYRPPSVRTSSPAAYRPPSVGTVRPPSTGVRAPVGMSAQRSFNANQPVVQYRPPSVGTYRPQSVGTVNYNVPPPVRINLFLCMKYSRYTEEKNFYFVHISFHNLMYYFHLWMNQSPLISHASPF